MAGDWIKVRVDLIADPRVCALADALGVSPEEVVGLLVKLWAYFSTHSADGFIAQLTARGLEQHVLGRAGVSEALEQVGWLEVVPDGIRVPSFEKYNASAKLRADARERMRRKRSGAAGKSSRTSRERSRNSEGTEKEENRTEGGTLFSHSSLSSSLQGEGCRGEGAQNRAPATLQLTPEWAAHAEARGIGREQIEREWRKFRLYDFPRAVSDWDAAWQRWVLNIKQERRPEGGVAARMAAQMEAEGRGAALIHREPADTAHNPGGRRE